MKKLIIKLFILFTLLISFTGCYTLLKMYDYSEGPVNYNPQKHYEFRDYIYMHTHVEDEGDKNSPVSIIELVPETRKSKVKELEILSDKVRILYKGNEYYANVSDDRTAVLLYKSGLNITGEFIAEIGKVKLDNGKIIDLPPLKFEKYVEVSKYIPILDGLNIETNKEIYYGPLENYKGR